MKNALILLLVVSLTPATWALDTTKSADRVIHTVYNSYGIALSSTQTNTSNITTTGNDGTTETIDSVSTSVSEWRGGSLKVSSSTTNSNTTASDGSTADTQGFTAYAYDSNGRLQGASGSSSTTGSRGTDAQGQALGTYTADTTNTFEIRNGQAVVVNSSSVQQSYDANGNQTSTQNSESTYNHSYLSGEWMAVSVTNDVTTTSPDGSSSTMAYTTTYNRDANGVLQGISKTGSGTETSTNADGGQETYSISYSATPAFDAVNGWYIAEDEHTYDLQ